MKRFVWFFLAAFCAALAQVQPVEPLQAKHASCGCCDGETRACGMPDCALPPACPSTGLVLASAVSALRAESENVMPKSRGLGARFYAQFSPRPAVPAEIAPQVVAPTASVPAFKAHCSFLI